MSMTRSRIPCQVCAAGKLSIRKCGHCDGFGRVLTVAFAQHGSTIGTAPCKECGGLGVTIRCDSCGAPHTVTATQAEGEVAS